MKCNLCGANDLNSFVDLGCSPLANSFVDDGGVKGGQSFFPLSARVCGNCFLVQLEHVCAPETIFSDYVYFSSCSSSWLNHAKHLCDMLCDRFDLDSSSFVLEVASNDGYLLNFFNEKGVSCRGVEPAANVAEVAIAKGINTTVDFFSIEVARKLVCEYGKADCLIANNVFAHVPDIHGFIESIGIVLKDGGVASIEVPHLLTLMNLVQFDTVYHEHYYYFSLLAISQALSMHGLEVFDIQKIPTHGGSLRVFIQKLGGRHVVTDAVAHVVKEEKNAGLDSLVTYRDFMLRVYATRISLLNFLVEAKKRGERVAAYGAAAKGNTLLNFCNIGPDLIYAVGDVSPYKQGRYLPGSSIPVVSPEELSCTKPDYVLILPWNLKDEIAVEWRKTGKWNCIFVTAIPEVEVLDASA